MIEICQYDSALQPVTFSPLIHHFLIVSLGIEPAVPIVLIPSAAGVERSRRFDQHLHYWGQGPDEICTVNTGMLSFIFI